MVCSDRVRNDDHNTEDQPCSAYPLLLKLAGVFVELVGDGTKQSHAVTIYVTEPEAWLLRSKVTTGDKSASDPLFGVRLLSKLYRVLLAFDAGELPLTDEESPADKAQTVERLKGWAEHKEPDHA